MSFLESAVYYYSPAIFVIGAMRPPWLGDLRQLAEKLLRLDRQEKTTKVAEPKSASASTVETHGHQPPIDLPQCQHKDD